MTRATANNPFPGLRPFREDEDDLFFGRESQVDAMVDTLSETRFLAVVGTSGCGKSSLVNCGLRPALHRGLMTAAGSAWRMAKFRPGSDPIGALATALARDGVLFPHEAARSSVAAIPLRDIVETTLRMSKLGLIDIVEQARLGDGVKLLLIADQFEELFRYQQARAARGVAGERDDALALVNLLLEVRDHPTCPIYIVLTMRSDFLGDCTHFPGLAEAINGGQYLVPRLTRDERRAAIAGPVRLGGAEISPVLLTRLVNDVGDNPDQLSILQHALNRTWARWERDGHPERPLDLDDYESIGTMARALDQHAERAFGELGDSALEKACECLFKGLTDRTTDARGVRRPTTLGTLCQLAECTETDLIRVIDAFRKPSRSFLMPPAEDPITSDTVIDISHESLMRVWRRLATWADEESQAAAAYRRLAETATLHAAGRAGLWRDPDLQLALDWRERSRPNQTWADRYQPGFADAMAFLDTSAAAREAERQAAVAQRERELQVEKEQTAARAHAATVRVMRWATGVSLLLALAAIAFGVVAIHQSHEAERRFAEAVRARQYANAEMNRATDALADAQQVKSRYDRLLEQQHPATGTQPAPPLAQTPGAPTRRSVYIHVQSSTQDKDAQRLRQLLAMEGYDAQIEHVTAGPRKTQLRFFREQERALATETTALISRLLKSDNIETQLVSGYEAQARPRQLELWYGSAWFVVAGSFTGEANAQGRHDALVKAGFEASVIDTQDYPNFNPGLKYVVLGPFDSQASATAQRDRLKDIVADAYVKSGW